MSEEILTKWGNASSANPDCQHCGAKNAPAFGSDYDRDLHWLCDSCALQQRKKEQKQRREETRLVWWESSIPSLYQNTDPAHAGLNPGAVAEALAWEWCNEEGRILKPPLLYGAAGTGKTRIAMLVLKKAYFEFMADVEFVRSTQFSRACMDQFSDDPGTKKAARSLLSRCKGTDVLLFDDLGKEKFTERVELELYDLLEERTGNERSTIWTTNASVPDLRKMLSKDRRDPIIRRIRDFSQLINL